MDTPDTSAATAAVDPTVPAAQAPDATAIGAAAAAPAETPAAPPSRDIGHWKYTPWRGAPHWTHPSGADSFNEGEVMRLRNLHPSSRPPVKQPQ